MTNLEALQIEVKGLNVPEQVLKYQLSKQGLLDSDDLVSGKGFDLAIGWSLTYALKNPKQWQQGDMSETMDLDNLTKLITYYFNKHGEISPLAEEKKDNTISNASYFH